MNLRTTIILALVASSSFLAEAGEVVIHTWNHTSQTKEYGEWNQGMRDAGWRFGTMGAAGSQKDGRESIFKFRGRNDIFGCLYREYRNETQCGTHIWNENNALFRVEGKCKIEKPTPVRFTLTCGD